MKFDIFIRRAFEALKISSQNRLAILLDINRAGITQAKKKGKALALLSFKLLSARNQTR